MIITNMISRGITNKIKVIDFISYHINFNQSISLPGPNLEK